MNAQLRSWGNYPPYPQASKACHWRSDLPEDFAGMLREHGNTLAYGAGLSYGDSCLAASDHVLHMRTLDRFISADWAAGVLTVEAGVTLSEVLAVAIPRGWFLPVTPGTKYVTVGGAVANDVHGKNHHRRGTFGRYIRALGLLRSDTGRISCSASEQPDIFTATIGGLGLTGIIEWVQVTLLPIRSSRIEASTRRFDNLAGFFALSDELEKDSEFCVAWVDCSARGRAAGRGIFMAGNFASDGELAVANGRKLTIPVTPPFSLINSLTLRVINELYWRKAPVAAKSATIDHDSFLYPLDAIVNWNRIYGTSGFQQYQAVIPEREAHDGVGALLRAIGEARDGSFLTVLKRCGDLPSPGLLSFPMAGTTLALDFPQSSVSRSSLFQRLDAIVREARGRLYPAKDAHMSAEDFRRGYPAWVQLEAMRDPALLSRFWQRVTL